MHHKEMTQKKLQPVQQILAALAWIQFAHGWTTE